MNSNNAALYYPEIASAIFILLTLKPIFFSKDRSFSWQIDKQKFWSVLIGIPVYLCMLAIGSIWIEYPSSDKNYVLLRNKFGWTKWEKFETRILHKPFCFDGYHISDEIELKGCTEVSLGNNVSIKIYFHIADYDIETILDEIGPSYHEDFNTMYNRLILPMLTNLVYITPREEMSDYHKRLRIFKDLLRSIGIRVVSTEFIYLHNPVSNNS